MTALVDGLDPERAIVVTGAAGAIGSAVVRALANAGCSLILSDVNDASLRAVAATLPDSSVVGVLRHRLDEPGAASALVTEATRLAGIPGAVVHVAGVLRRSPLSQVTDADWDIQHAVNLKAAFFLLRDSGELMQEAGMPGSLVAFTSQAWWSGGHDGSVVYAASKGGLTSLVRGLARTYGTHGIRVNAVAPGAVDTDMLRRDLPETRVDQIVADTPLGRLASPEDMVGPVLFLLSPASRFVTGTILNVSGGWLAY